MPHGTDCSCLCNVMSRRHLSSAPDRVRVSPAMGDATFPNEKQYLQGLASDSFPTRGTLGRARAFGSSAYHLQQAHAESTDMALVALQLFVGCTSLMLACRHIWQPNTGHRRNMKTSRAASNRKHMALRLPSGECCTNEGGGSIHIIVGRSQSSIGLCRHTPVLTISSFFPSFTVLGGTGCHSS